MNVTFSKAHLMILFAILFITIGYIAPIMYAAYAPADRHIEVNSFTAQNTTTADSSHMICFDRDMRHGKSASVFTELYLLDGNNNTTIEVDSQTMDRYIQGGNKTIKTSMELPDHISEGEHKYILVIEIDFAQGRVVREFMFTSETFTVENSTVPQTTHSTTQDFTC